MGITHDGGPASEDEYVEVLRLIMNDAACDPFDANLTGRNALEGYKGPAKGFSWLLSQITSLEIQAREKEQPLWSYLFESHWAHTAGVIRVAITSQVVKDLVHQLDRDGYSILHRTLPRWIEVSTGLDARFRWQQVSETEHTLWEYLLREIFQAGVNIHSISPDGTTPFQMLFRQPEMGEDFDYLLNIPRRSRRHTRKLIARWLQILQEQGVDMQWYSEQEHKLWNAEKMLSSTGIAYMKIHTRGWVDVKWKSLKDPFFEGERGEWAYGLEERLGEFWRLAWSETGDGVEINKEAFVDFEDHFDFSTHNTTGDEDSPDKDSDREDEDGDVDNLLRIPGSWD
jgi:hypothetical protein